MLSPEMTVDPWPVTASPLLPRVPRITRIPRSRPEVVRSRPEVTTPVTPPLCVREWSLITGRGGGGYKKGRGDGK